MADGSWAEAERAKNEGNEFFKDGKFAKAIAAYTRAIELSESDTSLDSLDSLDDGTKPKNPSIQIYFANRAFCHIKMDRSPLFMFFFLFVIP
ncbi:unnamed protein product, partial [Prorocentrum cordatum]